MPTSCSAYNCTSRFMKGSGISFHRFPQDKTRRTLWIIAVRRNDWTPSRNAFLCSKHFKAECFWVTSGRKTLKPNAVPSLFSFSSDFEKKEVSCEATKRNDTANSFPQEKISRTIRELQTLLKEFQTEKHFTANCLDTNKFEETCLKPNAVPTIFNFPDDKNNTVSEESELISPDFQPVNMRNHLISSECVSEDFSTEVEDEELTETGPETNASPEPDNRILKILDFSTQVEELTETGHETNSSPEPDNRILKVIDIQKESDLNEKCKRYNYFEDFTVNDMYSPEKAVKALTIATREINRYKNEIRNLRKNNNSLKRRIKKLEKRHNNFYSSDTVLDTASVSTVGSQNTTEGSYSNS